jgi:hypothetical protein
VVELTATTVMTMTLATPAHDNVLFKSGVANERTLRRITHRPNVVGVAVVAAVDVNVVVVRRQQGS